MLKKLIIVAGLSLAASGAFAATAGATLCNNNTTAGAGTAWPATTGFIVTAFTPTCSAATVVVGSDDATHFWGSSVSTKGKTIFIGNTAGGAVKPHTAACATATACAASDASGAGLTAAAALGS